MATGNFLKLFGVMMVIVWATGGFNVFLDNEEKSVDGMTVNSWRDPHDIAVEELDEQMVRVIWRGGGYERNQHKIWKGEVPEELPDEVKSELREYYNMNEITVTGEQELIQEEPEEIDVGPVFAVDDLDLDFDLLNLTI